MPRKKFDALDWFGLRLAFKYENAPRLGQVLGFVIVLLGLAAVALVALTALELFLAVTGLDVFADQEAQSAAIRNTGLALAAMVGVPFLIWRTVVANRQVDVAEQSLFNEKLKAAADDLHARREIKRKSRLDNPQEQDFIEDDIVRRVAAIDRLEGLAQERPEDAPRITRLLCVYLRQMSKGIGPDNEEHPRADMEAAAQTIGRMKRIDGVEPDRVEIDLSRANLAGFDLSGLCFDGASFLSAKMQGANFMATEMKGANLSRAILDSARLFGTNLQSSKLVDSQLRKSDLGSANLQLSVLSGVWLQGADLRLARLQGANIHSVRLDEASKLGATLLKGACVCLTDLSQTDITQTQVDGMFLSESVSLPKGVEFRNESVDLIEFDFRWRAWQKEIGFDPDDPATWHGRAPEP